MDRSPLELGQSDPSFERTLQLELTPSCFSLPEITLEPFGFRAYVPEDIWLIGPPVLTGFSPGHDARLLTIPGSANETSFEIA